MDLVLDMLNVGVFVGEDEVPVITIPQGSQTKKHKEYKPGLRLPGVADGLTFATDTGWLGATNTFVVVPIDNWPGPNSSKW